MPVHQFTPVLADDPRVATGVVKADLADAATAGGVAAIANPLGLPLLILRVIVQVATPSAVAATVDAGVAADGVTLSDNLLDGLSVAAAGLFDNLDNGGTNGKNQQVWAADEFVTISQASGDVTDLAGTVTIIYAR